MEPVIETIGDAAPPVLPFWQNRLGLIAGGIIFVCIMLYAIAPPARFPKGDQIITIAPGQSLKSVGTDLKNLHYIRSRFIFSAIVTILGEEKSIPSGDYFISKPVTVFALGRQIAFGNHNLVPIKITIPEGDTVREIGSILSEKLPNFPLEEFLNKAFPHEGYLFPETYFLYPKTDPADIITEMEGMFTSQTEGLFTPAALAGKKKGDIVVMASLIEREARGADDRAIISSILWNRISRGMRLQVDATVAFAANKPDSALQKSDFAIDSPYNTYLHKGLPPAPIANPGKLALAAALNPATTSYLYYLHDKHGSIHYAKTYAEHLANIAKYLK